MTNLIFICVLCVFSLFGNFAGAVIENDGFPSANLEYKFDQAKGMTQNQDAAIKEAESVASKFFEDYLTSRGMKLDRAEFMAVLADHSFSIRKAQTIPLLLGIHNTRNFRLLLTRKISSMSQKHTLEELKRISKDAETLNKEVNSKIEDLKKSDETISAHIEELKSTIKEPTRERTKFRVSAPSSFYDYVSILSLFLGLIAVAFSYNR